MSLRFFHYPVVFCLLAALLFPFGAPAQLSLPRHKTTDRGNTYGRLELGAPVADTLHIQLLLRTADALYQSRSDTALEIAAQAWDLSTRINYLQGTAHALNTIGICLQAQGYHDSAIACFNRSMSYVLKTGNKRNLYRLYLNMAVSNFNLGKYSPVLEHYYQALSTIEPGNPAFSNVDSIALYTNIGVTWLRLGAYEQSTNALKTAWNIVQRTRDTLRMGMIYARLGEAATARGDAAEARSYYLRSLQLNKEYGRENSQPEILNSLAHLYLEQEQFTRAYSYIKDALRLEALHPGQYPYDRLHTLHNLGLYYLQKKEYRRAEKIFMSTLERAEATGYKNLLPHMESDIAELYAEMGAFDKAYRHMRHYALQKDTLQEQERMRALNMWMKSRIDEKDQKLTAQQLFIARQDNKLQQRNFLFWIIAAGSLFLAVLFVVLVRNLRNKQRLQQSEIAHLQQLQEINQLKAQVRGEEQERNRLARELHDGIASNLWAIKLNVDNLRQQYCTGADGHRELNDIYHHLDDTTQEVRKTAHNLMPDLLLEQGLGAVLSAFCERLKKQPDLPEIDFVEYGDIPRMDPEIEISIYRMIQELIQNVLKHASGATSMLVQLSCTGTLLNITVEDNGAGFIRPPVQGNGGQGLRHIRERVTALRGDMDVQSMPGQGTTVYLEFDIEHLL